MNEFDYIARAAKKMKKERYLEVIDLCSKALNINSTAVEAFDYRGNAKYELGMYMGAIEDFNKAIELEPYEAKHYFDRCWGYIKLLEFVNALLDINKAIELDKNNAKYYFDKAHIEEDLCRDNEAIVDYTKSIELRPNDIVFIDRGDLYNYMNLDDKAMEDYNAAINFNPTSTQAYAKRGELYFKLELYRDAIKDFNKALSIDSDYDEAYANRGKAKIELGLKDGLKDINKAIKLDPENEGYYMVRLYARGKLLQRKADLEALSSGAKLKSYPVIETFNEDQARQDIKDLNKILEANPDEFFARHIRAERYYYLKNYKKSFDDFTTLIKNEPKNEVYYYKRGAIAYYMGDYDTAIEDNNQYMKLTEDKNVNQARFTIALSKYRLGQYNDAVRILDDAISEEKACGLYYYRALAKYNMKMYVDAYKDFVEARKLKSDVEEYYKDNIPGLIKIFLKNTNSADNIVGLNKIIK